MDFRSRFSRKIVEFLIRHKYAAVSAMLAFGCLSSFFLYTVTVKNLEVELAAESHAPQFDGDREMTQQRADRTAPVLAAPEGLQGRREIADQPPEALQHSFPRLPVESRVG